MLLGVAAPIPTTLVDRSPEMKVDGTVHPESGAADHVDEVRRIAALFHLFILDHTLVSCLTDLGSVVTVTLTLVRGSARALRLPKRKQWIQRR